jgi:hypothetical protein
MTAPGMHLEFGESKNFQMKTKPVATLVELIKERLKAWPQAGQVICGPVREVRITDRGQLFAVVYVRRGQQLRLLDIYELPEGAEGLRLYLESVKELFCGPRPGGGR